MADEDKITRIEHTEKPGIVRKVWGHVVSVWRPMPLDEPVPDENLDEYDFLTRAAEALKYQVLRIEYNLSSGGRLRNWLKLNMLAFLILAIPALLILPPLAAIMSGVASITGYIMLAIKNITLAVLWGVLLIVTLGIIRFFVSNPDKDGTRDSEGGRTGGHHRGSHHRRY